MISDVNIGWQEILVILVVALIVYGERLPQVARKFGQSYAHLREKLGALKYELQRELEPEEGADEGDKRGG